MELMTINEFAHGMAATLKDLLNNNGIETEEVMVTSVKKNNTTLLALTPMMKGFGTASGAKVAPNLYVEGYYDFYRKNAREKMDYPLLFNITTRMCNTLKESLQEKELLAEFDRISNSKELAMKHVYPVLVSKEGNEGYLEDKYSEEFLDMAVIYKVRVMGGAKGTAAFPVSESYMERMGITVEELKVAAIQNAASDFDVRNMYDVLDELLGEEENGMWQDEIAQEFGMGMYVISNKLKAFGAASCMCEDKLKMIAKKAGVSGYYLLPSSVHECILVVKEPEEGDAENLAEMVRSINEEMVEPEERLTDSVYFFDVEKGLSKIA